MQGSAIRGNMLLCSMNAVVLLRSALFPPSDSCSDFNLIYKRTKNYLLKKSSKYHEYSVIASHTSSPQVSTFNAKAKMPKSDLSVFKLFDTLASQYCKFVKKSMEQIVIFLQNVCECYVLGEVKKCYYIQLHRNQGLMAGDRIRRSKAMRDFDSEQ